MQPDQGVAPQGHSHFRGELLVARYATASRGVANVLQNLLAQLLAEQHAMALLSLVRVRTQGEIRGMRREHRAERAMGMRPVTRPAVIGGLLDHAGAHRVHFDIAQAGEQIIVLLNQTGTETAFPQAAAAPVSPVDVLHIALAPSASLPRTLRTHPLECVKIRSEIHIVRTNIEIDDQLMSDALRLTGARTKREAVEMGLRTLLRLRQQEEIRRFRGKLQWEGDLDAMRTDA